MKASEGHGEGAGVYEALLQKLSSGRATVAVMGLGYVGLPLAWALHEAGFVVIGLDTDAKKIEALRKNEPYLKHLGPAVSAGLSASARFEPTTDDARLADADAVIVCVPTPLNAAHEPDLSYVLGTADRIGARLRRGQLVVLESTTYPGTTRQEFVPRMLQAARGHAPGLRMGVDVFAAFSPEREDPGNPSHTTRTIPKLVGGLDERSGALAAALYGRAVERVVSVRSAEVAEAAKLLENIFRAVNIALVNEMKTLLTDMGIDVWEVVRAASTKPFGFMPFWPGPGLGGHCIPIDPFYMSWKARQIGRAARFIELAGEVNVRMPEYVVERAVAALAARGKDVRGARVLVLGLAYKPDIDDVRESPSFELIRLFRERGASVEYSDPHVPATWPGRKHDLGMRSVELSQRTLGECDCVVISTNHSAFDYGLIARHAALVVDTRDAMRAFEAEMGPRLVRA